MSGMSWIEIARDEAALLRFLGDVLEVLAPGTAMTDQWVAREAAGTSGKRWAKS